MKIEKINDNQIRCTLTREELADRQMKLSELAYGTEKARMLFRDMMQQAEYEYGFEADDIPIMIEAVPLSTDSIILIITKIEYPEELDTRFSKFSEADPEDLFNDAIGSGDAALPPQGADDILGLFKRMQEESRKAAEAARTTDAKIGTISGTQDVAVSIPMDITKMFEFNDIGDVTRLAHIVVGFYDGRNDLYKNPETHRYYLLVRKGGHTPEDFNRVCNILSEYGAARNYTSGMGAYFNEHYNPIIEGNAIQMLAEI